MNFLLHFFIGYFLVDAVVGNAAQYVLLIFIFSNIVDLDHIPYTLRMRTAILKKKFGSASRTRFHELYGLVLFSSTITAASFLSRDLILLQIIALSYISHLVLDFLVGRSRPFYPYSDKEVFLHMLPERFRIPAEVVLSAVLGLIWLASLTW